MEKLMKKLYVNIDPIIHIKLWEMYKYERKLAKKEECKISMAEFVESIINNEYDNYKKE